MPEIYKRYIDDGIGATSLNYNQLLDFINFVQNFHPAVKFTYEISEKSVTFLDMKLYLKQGKLTTSVHYKSTDSHSYRDYRSSHNPSTKNSIPFSQFLGLRRLCSDDADFEEKAEEMVNFFLKDDTPKTRSKSSRPSQTYSPTKTLQPNSKTAAEERPIMSLLYHPSTIRVRKIILSNWSLLQARTEVAKIFSRPQLIAYKRDTNIRGMLVRSKLRQPATRTPGTHSLQPREMQNVPLHLHQR